MTSLGRLTIKGVCSIAIALTCTAANGGAPEQKQIFHQDLRSFGFITEAPGQIVVNYTDLNFLTDNLILVTINNRVFVPVEKSFTDQPASKLLLFDISQSRLVKTAEMPVEKSSHSVRALEDGRFAVLNETGLRACSRELDCGLPLATGGPLFVSPEGTKIVVGGNGQKEQALLDGITLKELARYPYENPSVIPGDRALLVAQDRKVYARVPGQLDRQLLFEGLNGWPTARFINHDTVAGFESDTALAVARLDGTILFRVPVKSRWELSEFSASASGTRFCLHEGGVYAVEFFRELLRH
jgi:hypothetical protein